MECSGIRFMPCKLFDQISGKIHRDKDLYDLISDTMVFETGRRHLCNRSLYYREKFLFRNKTGARKNLSLSLSLRSRKIEKSGACIGECVPRACVRLPPSSPFWFFSFAGRIYTEGTSTFLLLSGGYISLCR